MLTPSIFTPLPSNAIQPESKAIDSIFQKIEGSDLDLQNVGWKELDDTVHALGAVDNAGGGGSHGHGSIDLDVSYVDVIIATKD